MEIEKVGGRFEGGGNYEMVDSETRYRLYTTRYRTRFGPLSMLTIGDETSPLLPNFSVSVIIYRLGPRLGSSGVNEGSTM